MRGLGVVVYVAELISFALSCRVSGTLTVEEVYKDRDQFAALVREVAAPDVGRMGIEILSFTIKDVYDDVQYLASLGKAQTAAVKRDADVGVAQANRDAGIRVGSRRRRRGHWFHSAWRGLRKLKWFCVRRKLSVRNLRWTSSIIPIRRWRTILECTNFRKPFSIKKSTLL